MNLQLIIQLAKNSFKQTFAYRTSSLIMFVVSLLFFLLQILSSFVLYSYTDTIYGYSFNDSINLICTGAIISSLSYAFFVSGNEAVYEEVLAGEMDYAVIRPVNSYWFYTFYGIDLQNLITAVLYLGLQFYLFYRQNISLGQISLWSLLVCLGVWYVFLIARLLVIIVFYTDRASAVQGFTELLEDAAAKPKDIYPQPLRYLFIFLLSYLMVFNGPVDVLKGSLSVPYFIGYLVSTAILSVLSYKLWFVAIKKYQSAN